MTAARHWDLVYSRPSSLSWDGVLLLVAFLLHTPLFFMKMKAPPERGDNAENYVRIENIEAIMKRVPFNAQQMFRPPETLSASRINNLKLSDLLKNRPALPLIEPVLTKAPDLQGVRLTGAGATAVVPTPVSVPSTVGGLTGVPGAGGLGVSSGSGDKGPLVGKEFTAKSGTLGGIGSGAGGPTLVASRAGTGLVVPVSQKGTADAGLVGPVPIVPRVIGLAGGSGPSTVGGGGRLVGAQGGVTTRLKLIEEPQDPTTLPVIVASSRSGQRTTVTKSMFPIVGPLANRKIKYSEPPEFPEWARKEGVEATVILKFTVLPNGKVKDNIVVQETTGYEKLDQLAIDALSTWVFERLPGDTNEEQASLITMKFSLK